MDIGPVASSPVHEREWARLKDLQQAVLRRLAESGPIKWGVLYSHFDEDGTGEIGKVLELLIQRQHITVAADGTANITASGLAKRLKSIR